MMSWLFTGMLVLSFLFGILNGRMEQVSISAVNDCSNAVTLVIQLTGVMCLWSGLMRIAEASDLTGKLSRLFRPVMTLLFRHLPVDSKAAKAIVMNLTANLLGLGNAATPLGISAMKELEKISPRKGIASNEMAMLVVLNTRLSSIDSYHYRCAASFQWKHRAYGNSSSSLAGIVGIYSCRYLNR